MRDTIIWAVAMAVWMLSTAVFIGGHTKQSRRVAMYAGWASATVFAGAAFGWTVANCAIGWMVGTAMALLVFFVIERLQKLPPAQHHPHSPH